MVCAAEADIFKCFQDLFHQHSIAHYVIIFIRPLQQVTCSWRHPQSPQVGFLPGGLSAALLHAEHSCLILLQPQENSHALCDFGFPVLWHRDLSAQILSYLASAFLFLQQLKVITSPKEEQIHPTRRKNQRESSSI